MNTPKIRFKGFADDWEQRKFGELAEYKKGPFGSAITKDMFVPKNDESVKVYEQQNAINKDWSLERYFLPKEYALTKLKSFEVHGGDIIVSCAGTIGEIYEIPDNADSGVINQALMRVRVNECIVDKKMFIIVFSNMIDEFTRTHGNGSAIKNIPPFADLKPMEVLIPSIDEQKKLREHFSSLDNLITLHQRKRDETKQLKKFMLQKMFPKNGEKNPEIRFEGFTDDWEQRKVGDQMYIKSRIGWQALTKQEYLSEGDYYLITGTDIDETTHRVDLKRSYYVSKERYEMDSKIQVKEGDIIVTKDGTIGKVAMVTGLDKPATLNSHLFVLRDMSGKLDNHFLLHILNSHMFNHFVKSTKTGSTLTGLPQKTFVEFAFLCPKYEEQKLLSNYFDRLDHLITLHQRKCEKLKELKKFMLQNMFV